MGLSSKYQKILTFLSISEGSILCGKLFIILVSQANNDLIFDSVWFQPYLIIFNCWYGEIFMTFQLIIGFRYFVNNLNRYELWFLFLNNHYLLIYLIYSVIESLLSLYMYMSFVILYFHNVFFYVYYIKFMSNVFSMFDSVDVFWLA